MPVYRDDGISHGHLCDRTHHIWWNFSLRVHFIYYIILLHNPQTIKTRTILHHSPKIKIPLKKSYPLQKKLFPSNKIFIFMFKISNSKIFFLLIIYQQQGKSMFFGKIISKDQPFIFNEQNVDESAGQVLMLTNVVLAPQSKDSASLYIKKDGEEFLVVNLTKDKSQATINLFLAIIDEVTLVVKGAGIVHVLGFFQPEDAMPELGDEEDDLDAEEDLDLEDDEDDQEQQKLPAQQKAPAAKPTPQNPKVQVQKPAQPQKPTQQAATQQKAPVQASKPANQKAPVKPAAVEEEDNSDEDDFEDVDEELDGLDDLDDEIDDDDEGEDDDEDDDEEDEMPPPKKMGGQGNFMKGNQGKPIQGNKPFGGKPQHQQQHQKPQHHQGNKPYQQNRPPQHGKPHGGKPHQGGFKPHHQGGKPHGGNPHHKGNNFKKQNFNKNQKKH